MTAAVRKTTTGAEVHPNGGSDAALKAALPPFLRSLQCGSPRSLAANKTLAQDGNLTAPPAQCGEPLPSFCTVTVTRIDVGCTTCTSGSGTYALVVNTALPRAPVASTGSVVAAFTFST